MTLRVIVVEDDPTKFGIIHESLVSLGIAGDDIKHEIAATQALISLKTTQYDLMLLDINIPRRLGEGPRRGGGLDVLRDLNRDSDYHRPRYIVGITAYEDVIEEFGAEFEDNLWSLIHYSESSDRWKSQLGIKVDYIKAVALSRNFSDGVTFGSDLAIISALDTVEFSAIRRIPCDWQPLRLTHDETRYLSGSLHSGAKAFSVIAAAAPRMGMAASAVLASKMIHQFRPRYIAMLGICAGRAGKVQLGDVIIADPTWDWGSGKIESRNKVPTFLPAPHQLDLDVALIGALKDIAEDKATLASIKEKAAGKKPISELSVHFGPLVSGAAVVADKSTFSGLLDQHRGILGIDMEAYGVAVAALGSAKPRPIPVIVKGVSDYADAKKNDEYQEYAASVSAAFLHTAASRFL